MQRREWPPVERDADRPLSADDQVDIVRGELKAEGCVGARSRLLTVNGPRASEGEAVRGNRLGRVVHDRLVRLDRSADLVAETLIADIALRSDRLVGRRLV